MGITFSNVGALKVKDNSRITTFNKKRIKIQSASFGCDSPLYQTWTITLHTIIIFVPVSARSLNNLAAAYLDMLIPHLHLKYQHVKLNLIPPSTKLGLLSTPSIVCNLIISSKLINSVLVTFAWLLFSAIHDLKATSYQSEPESILSVCISNSHCQNPSSNPVDIDLLLMEPYRIVFKLHLNRSQWQMETRHMSRQDWWQPDSRYYRWKGCL